MRSNKPRKATRTVVRSLVGDFLAALSYICDATFINPLVPEAGEPAFDGLRRRFMQANRRKKDQKPALFFRGCHTLATRWVLKPSLGRCSNELKARKIRLGV